jgi:hypothetical protein
VLFCFPKGAGDTLDRIAVFEEPRDVPDELFAVRLLLLRRDKGIHLFLEEAARERVGKHDIPNVLDLRISGQFPVLAIATDIRATDARRLDQSGELRTRQDKKLTVRFELILSCRRLIRSIMV